MIRRLRGMSLRGRLTLGMLAVMVVGLLAADVASLLLMKSYLLGRVDAQLTVEPPEVSGALTVDTGRLCTLIGSARGGLQQLPTSYSITVLDAGGAPLCRYPKQPTSRGEPLTSALDDQLNAAGRELVTVPGTQHSPWRVRYVPVEGGYIVIGISLADAIDAAGRLQLIMVLVSLTILIVVGVGGRSVVRLALRPLTRIEETADAIAQGDLSQRIEGPPPSTEVGRLALSLNTMLAQIEHGFDEQLRTEDRLRQFLADASHELRTPLASIRGHSEMCRQGIASSPEEVAGVLARIESESIRMGDLVDDLLLLARLDASPELAREPVDLLSLASDVLVDARARDPQRRTTLIQLTGEGWLDDPPVVLGDQARIRQVLTNLVSNVLRYTPAGSPYEIGIGVRDNGVQVRVVDHGPGLREGTAGRVFERFYRAEPSRVRSAGGAGLGLSIVAGLMAAHHGSVSHQPTPGGGSTFVLTFPEVFAG